RYAMARSILSRLSNRKMAGAVERKLSLLADGLQQAERQLAEGQAGEARQTLAALGEQGGPWDATIEASGRDIPLAAVEARLSLLRQRCDEYLSLSGELLSAMEKQKWSDVLAKADKLLA